MGMGSGTQEQTSNQTATTSYAPWTQRMHEYLGGQALALNNHFLQPSDQSVAGFTPDQMHGMDMFRRTAMQFDPANSSVPTAQSMMSDSRVNAHQLGGNDHLEFMNPYLETVGRGVIGNMRREHDNTQAGLGARYAARGGLGGSGESLARGQTARAFNEQVPQVMGQLLSGGYDRANQLASQNVDRRMQAEMANSQNALAAHGLHNTFQNSELQRQMAAAQGLMGAGQMQQNLAQLAIDTPHRALERMAGYLPPVYDQTMRSQSTQTSPDNSPSPFQQLLGLGTSILGMPSSQFQNSVGGTVLGNLFNRG